MIHGYNIMYQLNRTVGHDNVRFDPRAALPVVTVLADEDIVLTWRATIGALP